jgi:protein-S-isoprenylcysteine O-methyltransferase Ste14
MPVMAIRGRIPSYTRRMLLAAWCGALLFLASLGYFAWFYLVALDKTLAVPAEAVAGAIALDIALFSLFALHHSLFARTGAKAWLARRLPAGAERSAYVWLASLLFLAVCLLWRPLPGVAWAASGGWRSLLHGVQLAGAMLTLKSASRIEIWDLAGVRQARAARASRLEGRPAAAAPRESIAPPDLEVGGPYRWVRHPIYFGWILLVFGTPTMTGSRLLFASISTLYLIAAIPFEERSLTQEFGAGYTAYQQQVRWKLIPGLW